MEAMMATMGKTTLFSYLSSQFHYFIQTHPNPPLATSPMSPLNPLTMTKSPSSPKTPTISKIQMGQPAHRTMLIARKIRMRSPTEPTPIRRMPMLMEMGLWRSEREQGEEAVVQ